jgi:hypothetical protein
MRKLISTLLCLLICAVAFAQTTETQHLTFKGIPIDGSPVTFGNKLKAAGFTFEYNFDGNDWYKGSFAGYNNCDICVKYSHNLVYEVVVLFPECYSWTILYNNYQSLVNMLTTKYGNPYASEAKFENTPSYRDIDDDNDKFYEVKNGHCVYYALFGNLTGSVIIEIKDSIPRVGLHYIDDTNNSAKDSAALDDL